MRFGIGQSVRRTEDMRFVAGHGQYTDDLHFPNETFACFYRSGVRPGADRELRL